MLSPNALIRSWGPPSAVVDEVTGDVAINIGGVVIETVSRAYDARQKLADEAGDVAPHPEQHVVVPAISTPSEVVSGPTEHTPRQLEQLPGAEPLGAAANLSNNLPANKDVQLPPHPSDVKSDTTSTENTQAQKRTLVSRFGDLISGNPKPENTEQHAEAQTGDLEVPAKRATITPKRDSKAPKG